MVLRHKAISGQDYSKLKERRKSGKPREIVLVRKGTGALYHIIITYLRFCGARCTYLPAQFLLLLASVRDQSLLAAHFSVHHKGFFLIGAREGAPTKEAQEEHPLVV